MPGGGQKLADIQVLRAVACLMVLVQHSMLGAWVFSNLPGKLTMPFYLGVHLFFVISGYVVTRSMFQREVRPIAFLVRRFFRLAPAITVFLLFSLFVFAVSKPPATNAMEEFRAQSTAIFLGALTLHQGAELPPFRHMWSLSVEYQFYAAFAFAALAFALARREKHTIKYAFLAISIAVVIVCYATLVASYVFDLGAHEPRWLGYIINWGFFFLALGVALALLPERAQRALEQLAPWRLPIGVGAFLAAMMITAISEAPHAQSPNSALRGLVMPAVGMLFTVVVAMATIEPKYRKENRSHKLLVWIGNRSYSLYLFHWPVVVLIAVMVQAFTPWMWYVNPLVYTGVQFVALFALSVPLAALCFTFVEGPGQRLGSFLGRAKPARA
jgi:peptidoglycan/LPS O-acetylase OafA/YrhL